MTSTCLINVCFQACRIPHTKATKTKRIKGIGFDSGVHLPSGGDEHDQRTAEDLTDFDGSTCETDTGVC